MAVQTRIKLRRATAAVWGNVNPVLALGEPGFEVDTNKLKIGNGNDAWATLDYASGGASVFVGTTAPVDPEPNSLWWNSETGGLYILYGTTWVDASPAVAGPQGPQGTQGPQGIQGPIGETGPQGPSGVIAASAPLTYDSATQTVGVNQSALSVTAAQVATSSNDKTASYTITAGDKNTFIRSTSATAITITLANVLAVGETINFIQWGAGQVTFAAGAGVTIGSVDSKLKINKQYSGATVTCVASGVYSLVGDLAA